MLAIKHLFHIAAPREQVYEAISSIEGLQGWWTVQVSGESEVGGILSFRFGEHGPDMKVLALEPNQEVRWECVAGIPGWTGNVISFKLDENEGKTRVRFIHEGWSETDDQYAAINFTWGRYLVSLRQLCQTGVGAAFGSEQYAQ
jgi:uncharacterized protein YndB with AHSA1/START domain